MANKVLTGREVQDAIAAGTLKPMDVTTYRWGGGMGSKGTQIFRKKWTRIRPGLYGRILGEYEVLVEECEPYESCPPGDRGWFASWTPIASGRSLDEDGRSDDPVPTYKEAKTQVERWLTDKKVDDPWVQNPRGGGRKKMAKKSKKYEEALERGRARKLTAPQAKLLRRITKERWIAESEWQQRSLAATKGLVQRGLVAVEKRSRYYGSDAPNRYSVTTEGRGALEAYEAREKNPTNDIDRGLILHDGEVFAKTGSHRQRQNVYRVLGRKPQTYYNLFEGDKTAGASRFVVTEEEFQKLKDNRVKVTRSRLKTPNNWHPHFLNNPGTPPAPTADLVKRLRF